MSWHDFVDRHLPQFSLFCTFNNAQIRKIESAYRLHLEGRAGKYYESIWGVMAGAEQSDSHCRMLLDFINKQVLEIRESGNTRLSAIRSALFNMLVCIDNDGGYKTYIAEIAATNECLQIAAWEVVGYDVPIVFQGKSLGTTADIALKFPNGQIGLLEVVSVAIDMSRVGKWEDLEIFLLEKISKKKESKLKGNPVEISIFPIVWGNHESLGKYQPQLESFFDDSPDFIGPFVITEFSRDGVEWHYDVMPAKELRKVWQS